MVTDTERNYTGTNTVVVMLIVLLALVASYFIVSQISDVRDDNISASQRASVAR